MKINYSDEPVIKSNKSIFLAGPTPRSVDIETWRKEALMILDELGFDGVVYVPERESDDRSFDYDNQVTWEREALYIADVIVFWVPRELETMPAFTTNVEFGYWLGKGNKKVLYGRPDDSKKNRYLDWLYETETGRNLHNDLKQLLVDAVGQLANNLNTNAIDVRLFIEKLASDSTFSFYPLVVSKATGISLDDVVMELIKLSLDGLLRMRFEIRCSDDLTIIDIIDDYIQYIDKTFVCPKCQKECIVNTDCMYLVFQITEEYKEFLAKKRER